MHGWVRYVFNKKGDKIHYIELVFLHPMGFAGHVVHFVASAAQNVNALFFMLGWNRYRFDKKHAMTRYAELVFLHLMGSVGHVMLFDVSEA
jgi:hypothetical protein